MYSIMTANIEIFTNRNTRPGWRKSMTHRRTMLSRQSSVGWLVGKLSLLEHSRTTSINRVLNVPSRRVRVFYTPWKSTSLHYRVDIDISFSFLNQPFSSNWMKLTMSHFHGIPNCFNVNSSVAASVQATRTFDLTVELGGTTHSFLNLNRSDTS